MVPYIAGAEIQALGLSRALQSLGADVSLLTTRFRRGLAARDIVDDMPVRRLPVVPEPVGRSRIGRKLGFHATKASQVVALAGYVAVRGRRFDVVHAHCLSASTLGAVLGARLAGVPIIVKPSLGGPEGELRKLIGSGASGAITRVLNLVDRFAVIDTSISDELRDAGIDEGRFVEMRNGVDLERFRPATGAEREEERRRLGLPDGPIALFVGQLVERKGVVPLLEAWRSVRVAVSDATLVFAGQGDLTGVVEEAAARPDSGVVLLGVRRDIVRLLRAASLLVLPSRNESFGNVVLEALACGLPVVAGPTGVVRTLDLGATAGRVVDPADPASIASAIEEILVAPDLAATLGARGRELALRFDFGAVGREYLAMYDTMLEERKHERTNREQ